MILKYTKQKLSFKFSLVIDLSSFDFTLIETHGWYSPSNKIHLGGVSRDHMIAEMGLI
jgi:hypothetical protein